MNSTENTTVEQVPDAGITETRVTASKKRKVAPTKVRSPPKKRRTRQTRGEVFVAPTGGPAMPTGEPTKPIDPHYWGTQLKPCDAEMIEEDLRGMGFIGAHLEAVVNKREMLRVDGFAQIPNNGPGMTVEGTGLTKTETLAKARAKAKEVAQAAKARNNVKAQDEKWAKEMFGVDLKTSATPSPESDKLQGDNESPEQLTTQSPESGRSGALGTSGEESTPPGRRVLPPREGKGKRRFSPEDEQPPMKRLELNLSKKPTVATTRDAQLDAQPRDSAMPSEPTARRHSQRQEPTSILKKNKSDSPAATETPTSAPSKAETVKREASSGLATESKISTTAPKGTPRRQSQRNKPSKAVTFQEISATDSGLEQSSTLSPVSEDKTSASASPPEVTGPKSSLKAPVKTTQRRQSQRNKPSKAVTPQDADTAHTTQEESTTPSPASEIKTSASASPPEVTETQGTARDTTTAITAQSKWGTMPPPRKTSRVIKPAPRVPLPRTSRRTVSDADRQRRAPRAKKSPETVVEESEEEAEKAI